MTNEEMKERIQDFIGTMSYYNAAEGNYSYEATERNAFKTAMAEEIKTWNITQAEFETLYNECDKQLTTKSDFTSQVNHIDGFKSEEE